MSHRSHPPSQSNCGPAPRVLAVDDNLMLLRSLERSIGQSCDLTTAVDGKDALRKFRELGPFPVLMTDQRMPHMTGDELIDAAKEIAPETVCLLLTGNTGDEGVLRVVEEGSVFQVLQKPCTTPQLFAAITEAYRAYTTADWLSERTAAR